MPSRQLDIQTLTAWLRMTSSRSFRFIRTPGPSPSAACQSSGLLAIQGQLPTARGSFLNEPLWAILRHLGWSSHANPRLSSRHAGKTRGRARTERYTDPVHDRLAAGPGLLAGAGSDPGMHRAQMPSWMRRLIRGSGLSHHRQVTTSLSFPGCSCRRNLRAVAGSPEPHLLPAAKALYSRRPHRPTKCALRRSHRPSDSCSVGRSQKPIFSGRLISRLHLALSSCRKRQSVPPAMILLGVASSSPRPCRRGKKL